MKQLTLPYLCPIGLDTDSDKLVSAISSFLAVNGVSDISALPVAIRILATIQTFAIKGIDAACVELEKAKLRKIK